jgi:kinesin family protein 6/9
MSMGKQEAFEIFKRDYQGNVEIEEQKRFLKNSYAEAKLLGELINTTRNKLSMFYFKNKKIIIKFKFP